ncbi:aminoacyl-tRNA hydrolase [Alkalicella caledoniensis]|uniref:Peptidyl-tRNA hydrolase n=1 Tax=Alkalicella caledoniensis TaxID=2731377 RepID=A0A7G9W862_ALKCA|nr:aminoacyl-tRNA hydrolase [Alkalicella caledoniensis]QNO14874.1 aminoacyl-tRNA hydrolase [Alkalicella caledoniensis]
MKLIVGLGNPGEKYENNRHNIGFMVLDKLARKLDINFNKQVKFNGEVSETKIHNEKVILLKPHTYMNLSGNSVKAIIDYFKMDKDDILVVYDDMDIETGKFKIRIKGSSGGQKGIGSIIEKLGSENIPRLKMGISRPEFHQVTDYVLGDFPKEDISMVNECIDLAVEAILLFVETGDIDLVMNRFNKK